MQRLEKITTYKGSVSYYSTRVCTKNVLPVNRQNGFTITRC